MWIPGETPLAERAIYVMTQERVQLALGAHPDFSASVIIVDEAHSIADGSRGVLLQWVIDDLLIRNPASQILFASPAIRNLDVFGRLFGLDDVVEFSSVEPTVTAMKLNEISARKDLDTAGALQWLRTRPLEALGLSPLLLAEVRAIANS